MTLQPVHALAPLMGLQLWLIITHIPWRDELQAYLLVRDSAGVGGLFANLHYEGHPSLWYLLLGVIEAVVRSPAALKVDQVAIALTTTVLVWRRAPFPGWVKLLILAGYYLLFEYGVIARSYGLGALLLFTWLIWRRTIWGWVILALMANVAVHFALLSAFCVAAGLLVERRWSWAGAAIWGAGCLAAVVTIVPAHDATTGLDALAQPLSIRILDALRRQSATLYPAVIGVWPYRWQVLASPPEAPVLGAIVGVIAGVLAPLSVWREPRARLLPIGLFLALTAMSTLLYPTYLRHVGVLVLLLIALEWMRHEATPDAPPAPSPVFIAWMSLGAACGLWAAISALFIPFAYGGPARAWITAHHLQGAAWAAYPGYVGSDLSAYFGRPTYNLQKGCLNSFIRWNQHAYDDMDYDVLADRIERPGPFAYVASVEDLAPLDSPLRLIARFDAGMGDNPLFLYRVDRPVEGAAPACP